MKTKSFLIAVLILYCTAGLSFYATAAANAKGLKVSDVEYLTGNEFVQLHFKINKMIPIPDVFYPDKKDDTRLIMRINNVAVEVGKNRLTFDSSIIDNIKIDANPTFTDVEIRLKERVNYRVFTNQKGLYIEFPKVRNVQANAKTKITPPRKKAAFKTADAGKRVLAERKPGKTPTKNPVTQKPAGRKPAVKKNPPVKKENLQLSPVKPSQLTHGGSAVIRDIILSGKEADSIKFDIIMSNPADFSVIPIPNEPARLAIDFKNTHASRIKKIVDHLNVKKIRGAYNSATVYRLVFDLHYLKHYNVAPKNAKGNVLEVAFFNKAGGKRQHTAALNKKRAANNKARLKKPNNKKTAGNKKKVPTRAKKNISKKAGSQSQPPAKKIKRKRNNRKPNPAKKSRAINNSNTIQLGANNPPTSPGIVVTRNASGIELRDIRSRKEIEVAEKSIQRAPAKTKRPITRKAPVKVENTPTESEISNDFFDDEKSQIMQESPQNPTSPGSDANRGITFLNQTIASGKKQYTGEPMGFNFHNADLKDVIKIIGKISGLNIILDPGVGGRVTAQLSNVPWDQALDLFLKINGLDMIQEGNILRIGSVEKLAQEAVRRRQLRDARQEEEDLGMFTKTLSFAKVSEVSVILKKQLSKRGEILEDARTNTLIISEVPDKIEEMKRLIEVLDTANPQVSIEARIVETNANFIESLGIQWGYGFVSDAAYGNQTTLKFPNNIFVGGNQFTSTSSPLVGPLGGYAVNLPASGATAGTVFSLGNITNTLRLDMALSAMQTKGNGRIISAPKTTTQNNMEATVAQGRLIPVQTIQNNTITVIYRPAVLQLKVTPQITAEGSIVMTVDITNDAPDFANIVNDIPPLTTQSIKTTVMVADGGTIVIGGMYKVEKTVTKNGVPILNKIPILGNLFKSYIKRSEQRELLIFITPRIIK
ncbi:MAG: type IV pilus secretin PilQ [bacterium]|nr:type IV pilus secretin PilQ [bacterium]